MNLTAKPVLIVPQIDRLRFPNFHRLQQASSWYRNTSSVHSYTNWAVPSILAGRRGDPDQKVADRKAYPDNLFSLLEPTHRVRAIESTTAMAAPADKSSALIKPQRVRLKNLLSDTSTLIAHTVVPEPYRHYLPGVENQWSGFTRQTVNTGSVATDWPYSGEEPEKVRRFFDLLEKSDPEIPQLYFLHVVLPHYPFRYSDTGRNYAPQIQNLGGGARTLAQGRLAPNRESSLLVYQAHLLQTRFADVLLGHVLDQLERHGLFEDSLLVVMSDHGAGFIWDEGVPEERLTGIRASEIMYVPLFIKSPGQVQSEISDRLVETIDVVPSVMEMLGVDAGLSFEGISVLDEAPPGRQRQARIANPVSFGTTIDPGWTALHRKIQVFGSGDLDTLYYYGPHRELIDRPVSDLRVVAKQASYKPTPLFYFANVDLDSAHLPAYFEGSISTIPPGIDPANLTLAVAVNGIIRNTFRPMQGDEELSFAVRIPSAGLVSGSNQIDIYAVRENQDGTDPDLIELIAE